MFLRAINLQETALGADHPSLALSLDGRAKVLKMQVIHLPLNYRTNVCLTYSSVVLALGSYTRVVAGLKSQLRLPASSKGSLLQPICRAEDREFAGAERYHTTVGTALDHQGKYTEADPLYLKAIAIHETRGLDHPHLEDAVWFVFFAYHDMLLPINRPFHTYPPRPCPPSREITMRQNASWREPSSSERPSSGRTTRPRYSL